MAILSGPINTILIDCLNDHRHEQVTVKGTLKKLMESNNVIKVMCGCGNDIGRLKKDYNCFPIMVVDIQHMFSIWKTKSFEDCYQATRGVMQERAIEKRKDASQQSLRKYLNDYDAPGLDFLMKVFNCPNVKDKSVTCADWRKRPLSLIQRNYAAMDGHYTFHIFYKLYGKVSCLFNFFPARAGTK